ncbi:MAG TPA: hypothetical protein VFD49_20360 [Candidatus Dormibacteraeota bacterium]|nr:hypothetical protein [Candidatus Dormibacteraeota bacterium]
MGDLSTGPYLSSAFLCERVLEEKDGVLSAIRIVDRILVQGQAPPGAEAPPMPSVGIRLIALIALKNGPARGSRRLELIPKAPSGLKLPSVSVPVLLEGDDDRGVNLRLQMNLQAREEGIYWFDVRLDGELLTRMPLRIVYQIVTTTAPPQL